MFSRQNRGKKPNSNLSDFFRSLVKTPIRRLFELLVGKSQGSSVKYLLLSTPLGLALLSLSSLETSWIAVSIITVNHQHPFFYAVSSMSDCRFLIATLT